MSERSQEFEDGWHAFQQGKTDADNPHEIGTDEAMDWQDGWAEAEEESHD